MLNSLEVCLGQTWALWAALPNGFCQEARVFPSPRSGLCENSCLFELWARTECFWFVFYPWNILLRTKFLGKGENLLQILEEIKRKMLATRLNSFWTDHFPRKNPNIFFQRVAVLQEIPDFMDVPHFWRVRLWSNWLKSHLIGTVFRMQNELKLGKANGRKHGQTQEK